jgi:hypothetical protein
MEKRMQKGAAAGLIAALAVAPAPAGVKAAEA